mgnify:CR=1 FL=1
MDEFSHLVLGESRDPFDLDGLENHRQVALRMVEQAQRSVDIMSRHLDRRLFDQTEFVGELRRLALANRRALIRLLIIDTGPVIRGDHRLVTLAKRLPSFFEMRGPGRDHRNHLSSHIVVDGTGSIFRQHGDLYLGEVCFHDTVRASELTRRFQKIWDHGNQDVNLRQMRI